MTRRVKVRASSWGRLFDCAHSWEGTTLLGLPSVSGLRAVLGSGIHASTAAFDQARIDGQKPNIIETAGAFIDYLHRPPVEVDYRDESLTVKQAEAIGLELHARYCRDISPQYEFIAVEMTTKPLAIDCGNGITIELTGSLDRSRTRRGLGGGIGLGDIKTGRNAVVHGLAKTKGHRPQLGTYELLLEHTLGQPVTEPSDIIGLCTGSVQAAAIGQVVGCRDLLIGTPHRPGLIAFAADMFKSGLFPPNPQSWLCTEKYCARWATCHYHD